jgi:hypothetical protein
VAVGCAQRAARREREIDLGAEAGRQALAEAALQPAAAAAAALALLLADRMVAAPFEGEELGLRPHAQRRLAPLGRQRGRFGRRDGKRLDQPARLEHLEFARPQQQRDADRRELGENQARNRDRGDARGDTAEPARARTRGHDADSTSSANM